VSRRAIVEEEPAEISNQSLPSIREGLTEDIGVLEDAGPLLSFSSSTPIHVAKPGLKQKRPSGRGKGVPSSVLAADGSVTQQQASML
jgi:hypothetical protein